MDISAPEKLSSLHLLDEFDCGKSVLNNWLKIRALSNHRNGFTSVYIVHQNLRVIGFVGLSPTSVVPATLPRSIRTGQPPDPVPCILLGQLAVDMQFSGHGIGTALAKHALGNCVRAADIIGGRAVIVHATDGEAAAFWKKRGFIETPGNPLMLFRSMADVLASIEQG